MTERAKKWMEDNYRFIMLLGMAAEIFLISILVVLDSLALLRIYRGVGK